MATVLDLNITYLKPETTAKLAEWAVNTANNKMSSEQLTTMKHPNGYTLFVSSIKRGNLPEELELIHNIAVLDSHMFINFDVDGSQHPSLPNYTKFWK